MTLTDTGPLVAMYLIGKSGGYLFQRALWKLFLSGLLIIHEQTALEADRMRLLMEKYRDTPMDFTDASLVAAAGTLRVQSIFMLDKHFYTYRLADGQAFHVVP